MELRPLGKSGFHVSRLALGTMTWGRDTDEHEARDQLRAFIDAGGNLLDTADVYAEGLSEQIVGQLVEEVGRESVVIATKAVSKPGTERRFGDQHRHDSDAKTGSPIWVVPPLPGVTPPTTLAPKSIIF